MFVCCCCDSGLILIRFWFNTDILVRYRDFMWKEYKMQSAAGCFKRCGYCEFVRYIIICRGKGIKLHFMASKNSDRKRTTAELLYLKNENLKSNTKRHRDREHICGKWEVSDTLLLWVHLNLKELRICIRPRIYFVRKDGFCG